MKRNNDGSDELDNVMMDDGYSQTSKAYIVLNKETIRIEESLNVIFDESLREPKSSSSIEYDRIDEPIVQDLNGSPSLQVNVSDEGYPKSLKEARGHPIEQVIGKKIVKEKDLNDEWVNPTSDDNIILGNYMKKCLVDGPIWYKIGYPFPHKLDENEHPHTATWQCCKKGIEVQNDLKEFHEETREIHYSLNNNFKLLCSMVEPLAKAASQRRKK
ncbi:hypothetical protein Tco_0093414 [Tanacetum coccineum]